MKHAPTAVLLLLLLLGAAARQAAAQGVVTRLPEPIDLVEATYPPEAEAQGIEAEVGLELDLSAAGEVLDVRVIQPAGMGFDEAAVEALRRTRFLPAEIDGVPTAVTIEFRYHFEMRAAPEPPPPAQVGALRGVILERGTRIPIAGATIDAGPGLLAFSGEAGTFELPELPAGEVRVVITDGIHERFETTEDIREGHVTEVVYYLESTTTWQYESVVRGQRKRKEVSSVRLSTAEVNRIPGTGGDSVKVVQNLPGVARNSYGIGQLVVRGGNPNDTRTYIDGQYVPLLYHFGGITSVYASELLEEVQFEPGNFGARYGRAIGGRVELITRDPREGPFHLVADADLYDATAMIETPITQEWSVAASVRRSYVDAVINGVAAAAPDAFGDIGISVAPRYWDYQTKAVYKPDAKNRFRLDVYGSSDALALSGIDMGVDAPASVDSSTAFTRVALTWDHRLGPDTRARVLLAPGRDLVDISVDPLFYRIDSYSATARVEGFHDASPWLSLGAGLDLMFSRNLIDVQVPLDSGAGQIPEPGYRRNLARLEMDISLAQPGVWVEAVLRPIPGLQLVPGLRFDYDSLIRSSWVDPRFASRWALGEHTILKGAVGLYHQPPQPQYAAPTFGNPNLTEEGAVQYAVGAEQRIYGPIWVDLQLYYKDLFNQVVSSNRVVRRGSETELERFANNGRGRAYGLETLLRYNPDGRFFGWIAYSLSRSEQVDEDGSALPFASDQPHNFVALGSLELPEIWRGLSAGFRLRYTTGSLYVPSDGSVYDADGDNYHRFRMDRSDQHRLPDFFSLDLRIDKRWTFDESILTAYIDVQNVTNHSNAEGFQYNFDYTRRTYLPGLPIFPSIGIRWER